MDFINKAKAEMSGNNTNQGGNVAPQGGAAPAGGNNQQEDYGDKGMFVLSIVLLIHITIYYSTKKRRTKPRDTHTS